MPNNLNLMDTTTLLRYVDRSNAEVKALAERLEKQTQALRFYCTEAERLELALCKSVTIDIPFEVACG